MKKRFDLSEFTWGTFSLEDHNDHEKAGFTSTFLSLFLGALIL
jgi:hypothetical protein